MIMIKTFSAEPPGPPIVENPCVPSPCGPNSECRNVNGQASCACRTSFIGSPPNCRPECTINPECPSNLACLQSKCRDPCPGSCGIDAQCAVVNHTPMCTCPERFRGNPFERCIPFTRKPSSTTSIGLTIKYRRSLVKLYFTLEEEYSLPQECNFTHT